MLERNKSPPPTCWKMQRLGNVLEMSSLISSRLASLSAAENPGSTERPRVMAPLRGSVRDLRGSESYRRDQGTCFRHPGTWLQLVRQDVEQISTVLANARPSSVFLESGRSLM